MLRDVWLPMVVNMLSLSWGINMKGLVSKHMNSRTDDRQMSGQINSPKNNDTLILGYGNPGRQDDGLGPEFIRCVDAADWEGVTTQVNYQLTVEDAIDIAQVKRVIFVDASLQDSMQKQGFSLTSVKSGMSQSTKVESNEHLSDTIQASAASSLVNPSSFTHQSSITSHSLSPESLMELSRTLFNAQAEAWVLAIQGYEFDQFEEKLSPGAEANLQRALQYCRYWLMGYNLMGYNLMGYNLMGYNYKEDLDA